jgi:hypothetical protein
MKSFIHQFFLPFLAFAIVSAFLGGAIAMAFDLNFFMVLTAIVGLALLKAFAPAILGKLNSGAEAEWFLPYIEGKLFKVNPFLNGAVNHDQYVLGGKVVHIPQAGAPSTVVKNRNSYPGTAVQRTDSDITYTLDNYTTDPRHITFSNLADIVYDKIDSVIGEDMNELVQVVADDLLIKWAAALPQTSIELTTGAATGAYNVSGATGNRKLFTEADLRRAALKIRNQNKRGQLYCQLSSNMHDQLIESLSQNAARDFSRAYDEKNGIIGKLHGVIFYEPRSSVVVFDDDSGDQVVNALGAAETTTANDAGLLWTHDSVCRGMGEAKLFSNTDDPEWYGDIYSTYLRMGGRRMRADNKGIVALVQDAAA